MYMAQHTVDVEKQLRRRKKGLLVAHSPFILGPFPTFHVRYSESCAGCYWAGKPSEGLCVSSVWSAYLGTWNILRLNIHIRDEIEERMKGSTASADAGKGEFSDPRCALPIIRAFMEGELSEDLIMKVLPLSLLS